MPESAEKILKELTDVGLISAEEVTKYDQVRQNGAEALMDRLVEDNVVTEYQAEKFLTGQSSDIAFGDYLVIRELGRGGMGTVLLAKHRRMERDVAIKVLPTTTLNSDDSVARFYQEVKVAAQLKHPNIVHAYDAGDHQGFHYLVMEYVEGHDLARVLQQLGPIPPAMVVDYIVQAAKGLEYAHSKGVVHRDIKPSNLLLDDEGNVKILDMGLARIGGGAEASMQLTTTGQVMGTVEYMSPEQAEDTRSADARSDIYSLGCTLYRLVTGQGPFSRDTVVKTILAHRESEIPKMESAGYESLENLNNIFAKMVSKRPEDRYQTMSQLLQDLNNVDGEMTYSSLSPEAIPPIVDEPTMAPSATSPVSFIDARGNMTDGESVVTNSAEDSDWPAPAPPIMPSPPVTQPHVKGAAPPLYGPLEPRYAIPLKPHRGSMLLFLSIVAVLASFCYVGGIAGIIVWVFSTADIEEMDQNLRDTTGKNLCKSARILGQISIGISAIMIFVNVFVPIM